MAKAIINWVLRQLEDSTYLDPEHLWTLFPAAVLMIVFYYDVRIVLDTLVSFTQAGPLLIITSLSFQGLVAGILAHHAYYTDRSSFQVGGEMKSKEHALTVVIGVMLLLGVATGYVVPQIIQEMPYPGIQSLGVVLALGFYHVHLLVDNWKLKNEWPHTLAAMSMVVGPYLL